MVFDMKVNVFFNNDGDGLGDHEGCQRESEGDFCSESDYDESVISVCGGSGVKVRLCLAMIVTNSVSVRGSLVLQ